VRARQASSLSQMSTLVSVSLAPPGYPRAPRTRSSHRATALAAETGVVQPAQRAVLRATQKGTTESLPACDGSRWRRGVGGFRPLPGSSVEASGKHPAVPRGIREIWPNRKPRTKSAGPSNPLIPPLRASKSGVLC
jgi:hypothetical protein